MVILASQMESPRPPPRTLHLRAQNSREFAGDPASRPSRGISASRRRAEQEQNQLPTMPETTRKTLQREAASISSSSSVIITIKEKKRNKKNEIANENQNENNKSEQSNNTDHRELSGARKSESGNVGGQNSFVTRNDLGRTRVASIRSKKLSSSSPFWRQKMKIIHSQSSLDQTTLVIPPLLLLALIIIIMSITATPLQAIRITSFRVPPFVSIALPSQHAPPPPPPSNRVASKQNQARHPLDLAKPLLFDCDYTYEPELDDRLTVKWFRNDELEPFYQWLPQRDSRHLADWIEPLVDLNFVSDPSDPLKRYRSLLVRRLSVNLTGSYTCLVSSLAGQDMRRASLLVYQPPESFTFEHKIFPPKALLLTIGNSKIFQGAQNNNIQQQHKSPPILDPNQHSTQQQHLATAVREQPTQFKNLLPTQSQTSVVLVRPPNNPISNYSQQATVIMRPNNLQQQSSGLVTSSQQQQQQDDDSAATRIVYTHDGRPVGTRRPGATHLRSRRQAANFQGSAASLSALNSARDSNAAANLPAWMLEKKLLSLANLAAQNSTTTLQNQHRPFSMTNNKLQNNNQQQQRYCIQLHQFQCQATHVMPKPLMLITVKRDSNSIAQYLHESSSVSIRPFEVGDDYFEARYAPGRNNQLFGLFNNSSNANKHILYDIKVSATIALNVSLASPQTGDDLPESNANQFGSQQQQSDADQLITLSSGIQTVLSFRPSQRMSFECHLELTGTDFEQLKRINLDEKEIYQIASETSGRPSPIRNNQNQQQQISRNRIANHQQQNYYNNKKVFLGEQQGASLGSNEQASGSISSWILFARSGATPRRARAESIATTTAMFCAIILTLLCRRLFGFAIHVM